GGARGGGWGKGGDWLWGWSAWTWPRTPPSPAGASRAEGSRAGRRRACERVASIGVQKGHLSMKINKLLIGAILAIAIAAPIAGFVGQTNAPQPATLAFLHGVPAGQTAGPSGLAALERADAWLNSPPLTAAALRGKVVL